jgi:radical SAM superfamily enzyme YgiQ (UPF0313 family)
VNVVLISTYELGHQPFGLASPAAWLRARGAQVVCLDLSRESLREDAVRDADLLAFYVPMHTATRLATQLIDVVRQLNPRAHLCFYGLYAPVNEAYLRARGVHTILGGEFEASLAELVSRLNDGFASPSNVATGADAFAASSPSISPAITLDRLNFIVPDRSGLPPLHEYAHVMLSDGGHLVAGYTEASRGCKHLCRHCPIVPVYNGVFRIVSREVVLEDIRRQVSAGAEHITFGDPDFFNGPAHALAIVRELHREFPRLSYDVTIKIEHLLNLVQHLPTLRDTGCLFVTTAVESVDDAILGRLAKGHTRADFVTVVARFRDLGLVLQPTFVPFTPWTTLDGYRDLLTLLAEQDLVENIAPIQLGIRLLVPAGSRLLELPDMRAHLGEFDAASLFHTWKHPDPRLDLLAARVQELAAAGDKLKWTRSETFMRIWEAVVAVATTAETTAAMQSSSAAASWLPPKIIARPAIPHFTEPWYCCAEPTQEQFISIAAPAVQPPPQRNLQSADPRRSQQRSQRGSQQGVQPDAFL